ncbi:MAG: hypothetical protein BZ151_03225 [Desulfobacca sp. 4484_104]|nr:MAG: hypothetical protein BZ151_03225 [Desulfobacca sp. 4484_104]RLA90772.1 MAG: hypothetical protein DRG58_01135 [Deltaproteobacteria bacterium]
MEEYRKKQAVLCVLVFIFFGLAALNFNVLVTVLAVLTASAVAIYASTLEPERPPEEHHH